MSMGRISTYFNHPHMDPLISCAWDRRQGSLRSWITTTRPWQPWQLACLPFDHLGYHRAHYADKSRPIVSIIVDFKNVLSCFLLVPFLFSRLFFHQTCCRFVSRWWEHSPQSASESEFAGRGRPIPVPIRWILILIVIMDINRLPTFTDHDNPCKCQYIYTHTYIIIYIYDHYILDLIFDPPTWLAQKTNGFRPGEGRFGPSTRAATWIRPRFRKRKPRRVQ
jgi:hypothetical protein